MKIKRNYLVYILIYAIVAFMILLGSVIVSNCAIDSNTIHMSMLLIILTTTIGVLMNCMVKNSSEESILMLVLFIGCVMRIGYTLYNGPFSRTHDTWYYDDYSACSKSSYLMWVLEKGKLPDSYTGQLYHQPFSYFMSALSCKFIQPFITNENIYYLGEVGGKLSSCFASCGILLMIPRLGKELALKQRTIILFAWLVATFPSFYFIAGRIGEDAFSCFFVVAEILYTLKWDKNPSFKNAAVLAVFYGLGLQTNLSCVLPILFTIYIVLQKMFHNRAAMKSFIGQIMVFLAVSFPLGSWFYIRNYVKFGMPFTYVNQQTIGGVNWTGDVPLWKRYLPIDIQNLLVAPYAMPYDDYNLPFYFLKTELFGEFSFEINCMVPYMMLAINILITLCALWGIFKICTKKDVLTYFRPLAVLLIFYNLFEMYSYYREPFGCSMDARYFLVMTILKILFFVWYMENTDRGNSSRLSRVLRQMLYLGYLCFGTCSIVMFCLIS